ncbi:hypothetical protein [Janibacter melonis]|uniref:hypothetical protein n=1 Tax=Janibacter melonis TaxID=262209 RepID=UPI00177FCC8E|nr:hypothetical protein [Janibacter melonis]
MDLDEAVGELYGAGLGDFVAVRTRLAKEAGGDLGREVKALRKPTVTAWLLNLLARRSPELLAEIGELGERMRSAQGEGDAAALRGARPERDALVRRVVAATREIAKGEERALSASGEDEVAATVVAALADETSQAALASGMLVRALSYSGFGEVDLDDAVAARARLRVLPGGAARTGRDEPGGATQDESTKDEPSDEPPEPPEAAELRETELRLQTVEAEVDLTTSQLAEAEEALARAREGVAQVRERLRTQSTERERLTTEATRLRRACARAARRQ